MNHPFTSVTNHLEHILKPGSSGKKYGLDAKTRKELIKDLQTRLADDLDVDYDIISKVSLYMKEFLEKNISGPDPNSIAALASDVEKSITRILKKKVKSKSQRKRLNLLEKLIMRDGLDCIYCSYKIHPLFITIEHLVPACCKGKTTPDNLALACMPCNHQRGSTVTHKVIEKWNKLNKGASFMKQIVCPQCGAKHEDETTYTFDKDLNVICGTCDKVMFATSFNTEGEIHKALSTTTTGNFNGNHQTNFMC